MNVAYVVTAIYPTATSNRNTVYEGQSPKKAFRDLRELPERAEAVLEIWEEGICVETISAKELKTYVEGI